MFSGGSNLPPKADGEYTALGKAVVNFTTGFIRDVDPRSARQEILLASVYEGESPWGRKAEKRLFAFFQPFVFP